MTSPPCFTIFLGLMIIGALSGGLIKGTEIIAIAPWFWQVFALTIAFALWAINHADDGGRSMRSVQTVFLWPPLMCIGGLFLDFVQDMPESQVLPEWVWITMRLVAWASIPIIAGRATWILCRRRPAKNISR